MSNPSSPSKRMREESNDKVDASNSPKKPRLDLASAPCVPIVYKEDDDISSVALWYPQRTDEATRALIVDALEKGGLANFRMRMFLTGDGVWEDEHIEGACPPLLQGKKPSDIGVDLCEADKKMMFIFDNAADLDPDVVEELKKEDEVASEPKEHA